MKLTKDFESNRKQCQNLQARLREVLENPVDYSAAIQAFLDQHARLHSSRMEATGLWSIEDALLDDLTPDQQRLIPENESHSIAWRLWHSARCEDITMNLLVGGVLQVLLDEGWLEKLNIPFCDTGNEMNPAELAEFNAQIDLEALREYRAAVGRSTRQIVRSFQPGDLKRKVDPQRIAKIFEDRAVVPTATYLTDYWAKRTFAGLLLMPATRHHLVHFNEALDIRKKL